MKKKTKSIYNNYILNQNKVYNNINTLKSNTNNKFLEINDSISNHFIKRYKKNNRQKIQKKSFRSNSFNINSKTISINFVPNHYILDDLLKYLENKINPQLYEDLNNYLNKKLNKYYLESIDNLDKTHTKYIKVSINKNKPKKLNSEIYAFSSKKYKYKSYINLNALEKNKTMNNFNNNLNQKKFMKNLKSIKSINLKKINLKKHNLLSKLMISNDYVKRKMNSLGNKTKKNNNYINSLNNNQKNIDSHISIDNYFNISSDNIKDITFEYKPPKNETKINNNESNTIERIKIYKKVQPNNNNLKINRKSFEIILKKYKRKNSLNIDKNNFNNNTVNNHHYKSNSIKNLQNKKKYNFKLNILPKNNDKSFNILLKNKSNNIINDNKNSSKNNNIKNKNFTINVKLAQRLFLNKRHLLNEKLKSKLKKKINKYNHFYNNIN